MYLVKTYLASSNIHGVGVFAAEFIKKGTKTWEFNPLIDVILTPEQVSSLPSQVQAFIEQHAFEYPFGSNNFCLSLDHSQYVNHSDTPNIVHQHGVSYSSMDIEAGTELTNDYHTIDHRTNDAELKLEWGSADRLRKRVWVQRSPPCFFKLSPPTHHPRSKPDDGPSS